MARKKAQGTLGKAFEEDRKRIGVDGRYNSALEGALAKDTGKHKKKK